MQSCVVYMGLETRPFSLQIRFKGVISWKVFSRHLMSPLHIFEA